MKTRTKTITVAVCSVCNKDCDYPAKCLRCGEAFCYTCQDQHTVIYRHAMHVMGHGDGTYCLNCDKEAEEQNDLLHAAYVKIADLKKEEQAFFADIRTRGEAAEAHLRELLDARS